MNTVLYVKSFSKGQITIPKELRDMLGMVNEFWLKLSVENGKIIAEPVERNQNKEDYLQKLLQIHADGFDPQEIQKNRNDIEKQLKKRSL